MASGQSSGNYLEEVVRCPCYNINTVFDGRDSISKRELSVKIAVF
jgi:uncharacterized protein YfcZ (UPF0381/DUF406 family)